MEYAFGLFTMVAGSILGIYLSRFVEWRETRKFGDISGEWFSISHGGDHSLVEDKIVIYRRNFRWYFYNSGNSYGYLFDGYFKISSDNSVVGIWKSLRPGSTASGSILLIANPQGTSMSGFYSGSASNGRRFLLGWSLYRQNLDNSVAIKLLKSTVLYPH